MKDLENIDLREINIDEVKPIGFINETKLQRSLNYLAELKGIVDELLNIRDRQTNLPMTLSGKITSYEKTIKQFISQIVDDLPGTNEESIARKKAMFLDGINSYHQQAFNIEAPNHEIRLLELFSILKGFDNVDSAVQSEKELNRLLDSLQSDSERVARIKEDSETIINELRKKVSEQTVSDYAIVFQTEAKKNNSYAQKWLIGGTILSIIFLVGILLINYCHFLPTEIINEKNNLLIRYDFSNLVTKLILIALFIFLISFSYKQYSINKHQQTLNVHRQNALNSYKLFTESIIGEDSTSRNALMIQVAKAIYENTQTTGYLNERGQTVNPGIVELTKIIGQNKTV